MCYKVLFCQGSFKVSTAPAIEWFPNCIWREFLFFNHLFFCIFRHLRDGTLKEHGVCDGSRLTLLPSVETGLLVSLKSIFDIYHRFPKLSKYIRVSAYLFQGVECVSEGVGCFWKCAGLGRRQLSSLFQEFLSLESSRLSLFFFEL